jgi:transcriptional regulator with XRE-family HTH domain
MTDELVVKNLEATGVVPYNTLVGKAIGGLRSEVGITQGDMAAALEIGQSAYSKLESGQASMTLVQLRLVALQLKREPHQILQEADRLAKELESSGVQVPTRKEDNKAALMIGLGLLLVLMSKG